jgi:hypothetical protein
MRAYKIFEIGFDHQTQEFYPKTLFHGVKGSRRLPVGKRIKADNKMVTDGSRQHKYKSGFHAYKTANSVRAWIKRSKNYENRVVVQVNVMKCRAKPNAIRDTVLADQLFIPKINWETALPVWLFYQIAAPGLSTGEKD